MADLIRPQTSPPLSFFPLILPLPSIVLNFCRSTKIHSLNRVLRTNVNGCQWSKWKKKEKSWFTGPKYDDFRGGKFLQMSGKADEKN